MIASTVVQVVIPIVTALVALFILSCAGVLFMGEVGRFWRYATRRKHHGSDR